MTTQQWNDLILEMKVKNESEIISSIIAENKPTQDLLYTNWSEYEGETPIKSRTLKVGNEHKLNNKVSNDFRGHNVDQCNGYMFSTPIVYALDNEKETVTLTDWNKLNDMEDLDATTATYAGACGVGVRLLYVDTEGKERVMNANPWEFIFIMDGSVDEVQYVLRYYDQSYYINGEWEKRRKVEWYDDTMITYFVSTDSEINDQNVEYVMDSTEPINPQPHLFNMPPVVKFSNNELEQSDFHKTKDKIDAFDRVVSDAQNEIEEFRLAYQVWKGMSPTKEQIEQFRQTGAFGIGAEDDVSFLTKDINDTFVENTKKTLEEGIYRDGRAVNMSDENFSGSQQSGESRKWKLIDLENKSKKKERKFVKASKQQYKVLSSALTKKKIKIDYDTLKMTFTRTLPVDLLYESDIQQKLNGIVTDETRLAQASFIEDPAEEAKALEEQMPEIDLNMVEE